MRLRLLTATRPIEILKLTPQKIDWEEKTTIVITKKGKKIKKRPLYFTPSSMAILEPRMRRDVFFSFTKPQIKYVCKRITEIHNRVFPDYPPLIYGGRAEGGWVQNDFRRTSATILESYNSDLPYSAVMEVLGHARNDITSKYTGAELRKIVEAFKKLEAYVLEIDHIQKNLRAEGSEESSAGAVYHLGDGTQSHGKILVNGRPELSKNVAF
jgi:integrase